MRRSSLLALWFIFLWTSPLGAEKVWSLADCVRLALERYPALKAAFLKRKATEERQKAADRLRLPRLYSFYAYRAYRDPEYLKTSFGSYPIRDREEALFSLSLKFPLFHGLSISAKKALARLSVDLSAVEEERLRQELILRVKEAYFRVVEAEEEYLLAQKSFERRKAHLRDAEGFFREGLISRSEFLYAQAEFREAEEHLARAENRLGLARASLNLLLVRPLKAEIGVKREFLLKPVKFSYEKLLSLAYERRPEVQAASLRVSMARERIRLSRSRYFPWLDLEAGYTWHGDSLTFSENPYGDRENLWVGVNLNWELWDWGIRAREVSAARAEAEALRALLKEVKDQVALEVHQAWLELSAAKKRLSAAQSARLAAEEHFRLERARFREGLTDTTHVLDAETLLTRARAQEIAAQAEYEIARARLSYAVGLPELP